ncbi:hypothetical protein D3C72_1586420 [compost metagenome]
MQRRRHVERRLERAQLGEQQPAGTIRLRQRTHVAGRPAHEREHAGALHQGDGQRMPAQCRSRGADEERQRVQQVQRQIGPDRPRPERDRIVPAPMQAVGVHLAGGPLVAPAVAVDEHRAEQQHPQHGLAPGRLGNRNGGNRRRGHARTLAERGASVCRYPWTLAATRTVPSGSRESAAHRRAHRGIGLDAQSGLGAVCADPCATSPAAGVRGRRRTVCGR